MLTLMPTKADLSASLVPLYFILSLTLQVSGTLLVTLRAVLSSVGEGEDVRAGARDDGGGEGWGGVDEGQAAGCVRAPPPSLRIPPKPPLHTS